MSSSKRKKAVPELVVQPERTSQAKRQRTVEANDALWNQKFFELMVFRAQHDHVHVLSTDYQYRDLYEWTTQQRKEHRRYKKNPETSQLNETQIQVLISVGFSFHDRRDEYWFYQYNQLKVFQEKYGHVLVRRNEEFKGLGDWVVAQRTQHGLMMAGKESLMTPHRKALLDEIGFVWQIRNRPGWQARYEELMEFKTQHGHTRVPQTYAENKALGKWVALQRREYAQLMYGKKSLMTEDRLAKLNAIDFAWNVKDRPEDFDLEDSDEKTKSS